MRRRVQFPGFDAFYEMNDPVLAGPYRGDPVLTVEEPHESFTKFYRGEFPGTGPVTVRHAMGATQPGDVVWTTARLVIVLSQRVVQILKEGGFTGWSTYPVELFAADGTLVTQYYGLAVTGRCGPMTFDRLEPDDPEWRTPTYVGKRFDPASWDGSDIFTVNMGPPYMVEEVAATLRREGIENLELTRLSDVRTPRIALMDSFPGLP